MKCMDEPSVVGLCRHSSEAHGIIFRKPVFVLKMDLLEQTLLPVAQSQIQLSAMTSIARLQFSRLGDIFSSCRCNLSS